MEIVRLWLMAAGRQKRLYVAWKGKLLWLMTACLPPLVGKGLDYPFMHSKHNMYIMDFALKLK